MRVAVLVLVVSVSLTEAARCVPTSSPQCYKNSTKPDEDFICEWDERNPEKSQTHILHIWDTVKNSFRTHVKCSKPAQAYLHLEELGTPSRKTDIWVQTQVGNLTCNSSKTSVILECMVKYSKPQIIRMKRSAGILNITLDKPTDNKGAIYEIRWRKRDSEWQNTTFETKDSTIKGCNLGSLEICDSKNCKNVPIQRQFPEIRRRPVIRCVEKNPENGTRDIHLSWDAPLPEESVGGVKYILKLLDWPCHKTKKKKQTTNQTYNTSITYSEARISIIARNKVGHSPERHIFIPALKHLNYCNSDMPSNIPKADNNTCLEWYKLEDEVDHFVRHYYFLHIKRNKQYQTVVMCPFYSKQKAPINGPANVNISDITHESAVVHWLSIPVVEQQGFLQHYVIWISGQGNTKFHQVPANKTSFLIKDLHPGVSYTVSISGRTEAGLSWQDQTILIVCVVALLCTIICSVAARR
ncbi:hypothetical protein cypCar_00018251 [Cyprinus carpio]|nr:hypothetical protein cypCar_00018251 [Cyprinus carpio]